MKVVELINELSKDEKMMDMNIIIKDSFGSYTIIKEITVDKDGDLIISIDDKHYIRKVNERKIEMQEPKRY